MKTLVLLASLTGPAWIPAWRGTEPVRYCIAPESEQYRPEIVTAFWIWATAGGIVGHETRDCDAPRTIAYKLVPLWGWLGAAMYPWPMFSEPHAGDVWISNFQDWSRNRPLLLALLLHETGHALGMPESLDERDVMHPIIRSDRQRLSAEEVRRMRCIYASVCR